jgi:hypothetical protein
VVTPARVIVTAFLIILSIAVGLRAAIAETSVKPGDDMSKSQRFNATQTSAANNSAANIAFAAASDCDKDGWDVVIESLFLWRDNHTPSSVAGDFDVGVGPRIIARRGVNEDWTWDAEYFGVVGMNATASQSSGDEVTGPGLALPATFVGQYRYESNLGNLEFNVVRKQPTLSILAGVRYLRLYEVYRTHAELWSGLSPIPNTPPVGTLNPINSPFEIVRTTFTDKDCADNYLLGGQLGLRWRRDNNLWFYEATGKAGVFGNVYQITGETTKGQTAFVGDLNFSAGLHLTDIWSVRAGYNLLWIDGVALAPQHLFSLPVRTPFQPDDNIFLHGANIGLEATW